MHRLHTFKSLIFAMGLHDIRSTRMRTPSLLFITPPFVITQAGVSCSLSSKSMTRRPRGKRTLAGSVGKANRRQPDLYSKRKFYAVRQGRDGFSGILSSWDECTLYVTGVKGASFKSFKTYEEAQSYLAIPDGGLGAPRPVTQATGDADSNLDSALYAEAVSRLYAAEPGPGAAEKLIVFTDGACSKNGKAGSKAGYGVFFHEGSPHNVSEPLPGTPTNQRAEMTAALEAMRIVLERGLVREGGTLELHTDSMYTKNGMDSWISSWKKKKWKTSNGGDVKNKDIWVPLDVTRQALTSQGVEVSLRWVKGHSGIPGNEAADRLAVDGMQKML